MTASEASISQLAAALRYAGLGWRVVPLHSPRGDKCSCDRPECRIGGKLQKNIGKHPRMSNWQDVASTDPKLIREWFTHWPDANVGIATGVKSGLLGLDVDPDKGGETTLAAHFERHGPFNKTVEAITGSGGRHLLFRHPGGKIPNGTDRLGPGLDIRSDGGQMVVAPSMHRSGHAYEWQPGCEPGTELADAPAWLIDAACPKIPELRQPEFPSDNNVFERARKYVAKMDPAIEGQNGSRDEFKAAVVCVRGFRLSAGETRTILDEHNQRCVPPWSEKEIEHKIADAINKSTLPYGWLLDARPPKASPPPATQEQQETTALAVPFASVKDYELDAEPDKPVRWVLTPWVQAGTVVIVASQPNAGKTFLAVDWVAQAAAAGKKVYFVEEEGGRDAFKMRLRRAYAAAGYSPSGLVTAAHRTDVSLTNRKHLDFLARELEGFDLAVFDSLADVSIGVDENESTDMKLFASCVSWLSSRTGAAVMLLHHVTKEGIRGGKPSIADIRGHSSLIGKIDTAYYLIKDPSDEEFVRFQLHCVKQREGAFPAARDVTVAMRQIAATTTYEVRGGMNMSNSIPDRVLEFIDRSSEPLTKQKIEQGVGGDTNVIRAALDLLCKYKAIGIVQNGRYPRYVSLKSLKVAGSDPATAVAVVAVPFKDSDKQASDQDQGGDRKRSATNSRRAGSADEEEP
jgi:hypothetical protein